MHTIQQKLLRLADTYNIGNMSLREVAKIIDVPHPQIVKHHLEQLEHKQLIDWDRENKTIVKKSAGVTSNSDFNIVPVLGAANCGIADIYADERIEGHIKVSSLLLKNKKSVFAIKAVGASMNRANIDGRNIEDGDYVIIDATDKSIKSNDYVLSVIDEMANIKKIIIDKQNRQVCLISESSNQYPPIFIHESEAANYFVSGKVIQVIKQSNV